MNAEAPNPLCPTCQQPIETLLVGSYDWDAGMALPCRHWVAHNVGLADWDVFADQQPAT